MVVEFFDSKVEKSLLANIITNPDVLEQALNTVHPEDFYTKPHQLIYEIINRFYHKYYKPITRDILSKWLDKHEPKQKSSILTLFTELQATGDDGYTRYHIVELQSLTVKRKLYGVYADIRTGLENDADPNKIYTDLTRSILTRNTSEVVKETSVFDQPDERIREYFDKKEHPEKYRGIQYNIKEIDDLTGGMFKQQLYLVMGRTNAGKCLKFDTQILMNDGTLQTIEDIVKARKSKILTLDKTQKLKSISPTNYIYSGKQKVYKLTTKSGRSIEVTETHPLLTVHGWKKLKEISLGDRIAVPRILPVFGTSSLPIAHVKLLAYLIAEGSLRRCPVGFSNYNPDIRKDFINTVHESNIGDFDVRTHSNKIPKETRTLFIVNNDKNSIQNPIRPWLQSFRLFGKKSVEKVIPTEIFKLPKEKLAEFLGVLWSCDGSIYGKNFEHITFETGSPKLTEQVSHLLLRFGILTRYWKHYVTFNNNKKFIVGSLEVFGGCRQQFLKEIGRYFIGEKRKRVLKAIQIEKTANHKASADTIPMNLIKPCLPITRVGKIDLKKIKDTGCKFKINYSHNWNKYGICLPKVEELARVLKNEKLFELATSDIFWDTVKSIEEGEIVDTYDLEVASTHNFIANNIIVHNSRYLFNVACNVAKSGKKVMYCTIEMDAKMIQHMWESRETHIPFKNIIRATLTPEEEQKYIDFLNNQKQVKHPFYIVDIPQGCTTGLIESEVIAFEKIHGQPPDVVLIDYANLIQPVSKYKDRAEKYDHVFRELHEAARAHKTVYYTAAQQNRESLKATKVGTEHVAFSDASSYHCDTIFHIYADEKDEVNNDVNLEIIKGRYHEKGRNMLLAWHRDTNLISSWGSSVKLPGSKDDTSQDGIGQTTSEQSTMFDEESEY